MSLFRCTRCDTIDNTALGGYHAQANGAAHAPLCSACDPEIGQWHGEFPRRVVTAEWLTCPRGTLWLPHQAATMSHIGPFAPVVIDTKEAVS
jgi:hypothetical protein